MVYQHQPVLLKEVLAGLAIKPDGKYVDATFGRGGHSHAILQAIGEKGQLLALDKDPEAVAAANKAPFTDPRFSIVHASFADMQSVIKEFGWQNKVDGILMDLGVSSPQLDDASRGFSFTREGPLDMRMNPQQGMDAATWINRADADDIARILREYGEERYARRIANAIVEQREVKPLATTAQLADTIAHAISRVRREPGKHPATRSFQAIRIFINQELEELKQALGQALEVLTVGGRICVISFHSLEDRIVKRFIQEKTQGGHYPPGLPIKAEFLKGSLCKVGKLIRPSDEETSVNPRARSARLRIAEKIA